MADSYFIEPLDYAQERADKPFKHTFLQTERLLAGLNTLLPGQAQPLHDHPHQDKFYLVLEGQGEFTVGDETRTCGPSMLVLAPAGVPHGVEHRAAAGSPRLVFLTVIAPFG